MSSVCRFVLGYIDYVSDLAVANANLSSHTGIVEYGTCQPEIFTAECVIENVFSSPATSDPDERVFSSSRMLTRRHRANDSYLCIGACLSNLLDKTREESPVV